MLRTAALLSILVAASFPATAQEAKPEAKPDTVQVHGKALALSCAEWRRESGGTWTSTGPMLVGTETVKSVTLRGAETRILEAKCGDGTAPSASAAPAQPAKHKPKHGPAAPADGT